MISTNITPAAARTYPASGKFSPAQRDLYSAVLAAQKELIKLCSSQAGYSLQELHRKSCQLLKQELNQIGFGLGTEGDLERVLYPHYLSHPIGVGECCPRPFSRVPKLIHLRFGCIRSARIVAY